MTYESLAVVFSPSLLHDKGEMDADPSEIFVKRDILAFILKNHVNILNK